MYQEKEYVTQLKDKLTQLQDTLEAEFRKQGRRTNRESEKRVRKILAGLSRTLYRPYKESSLNDLASARKQSQEISSESQNSGV